jgi:hypothetical protein
MIAHTPELKDSGRFGKSVSRCRGFLLLEAAITLSVLTLLGLVLLRLSLNILYPRQWTMVQTLTDAFMGLERAKAERIPFDQLTAAGSPWPEVNLVPSILNVPDVNLGIPAIGRMPDVSPGVQGIQITGTLTRFRIPDSNNIADPLNPSVTGIVGGNAPVAGTLLTNPSNMTIWKVQSILTYNVPGRGTYVKSRTVIRSQ